MNVLVTIPHFFRRSGDEPRFYGSEDGLVENRVQAVTRCIASMHQAFGNQQRLMGPTMSGTNEWLCGQVSVVVVTTGEDHLVDLLPKHLFSHATTETDPRGLGFVCHQLMRDNADRFDWFIYLEDDLEVTDTLFLTKLQWFSSAAGPAALLQPNRYEIATDMALTKMYVDGTTNMPEVGKQFQDITERTQLEAELLGRWFVFKRVDNIHSGCFFLSAAQLQRVMQSPYFVRPGAELFGPLETAASLAIMTSFDVYKPARENAGFLELNHLGRRFLVPGTVAPHAGVPRAAEAEPS